MKNKLQKLSAVILMSLAAITAQAQQAITTTGGDASGSGGSVSYTVGQVAYTTNTGTNGSVAEGVQQPYEISVISGIDDAFGIDINFLAYPNPTTDFLMLSVGDHDLSDLTFQVFDINGKILENKKIDSNEMIISMENFAAAVYFLKIIENNKEVKNFKIIKN